MRPTEDDPALAWRQTMQRCPGCGRTILTQLWVAATQHSVGQWKSVWPPIEPVLGTEHDDDRCASYEVATS